MSASLTLASLPVDVFLMFAVFCRVGAMFMTAPAFGDFSLSPRLRLAAALAVTAALAPVTAPLYPNWAQSGGVGIMGGIIIGEVLAGAFLGLAARLMMSALNVAGQIIAFQMGLSLAQIFDPTQELQGAIVGGFLAILGTTMIFVTDLHHMLLAAIRDSYVLMAPGSLPRFGDMSTVMVETLSSAFSLGLRLSAPFVLFGLVFYVGAGVLNRLMPQAQVFFMLMPANLGLGLMLLMLTVGLMMTVFLEQFEAFLAQFLV
ncbi:MAG: flagellar type III secretion system protein FliR [Marinicaulis sp.]|nr:flagellar type III secretion system protein FliR [Marinicaulis sp.]NNE41191.1 flagellar type III secretion system protein FliR [Marinicaulis sp.]NNL88381.1 flagellar type III secretion system protein FliR [Marinicaulis sp.]